MIEYIIENCSNNEIEKLLASDILWFPDNIYSICNNCSTDVFFESKEEADRALKIIGRN